MTQLERARASVVMNINESHYSAIPWDNEGAGSRGVSGGPAQGGDVGATMETQCTVEDPVRNAPLSQLGQECPVIDWGSNLRDVIGEN